MKERRVAYSALASSRTRTDATRGLVSRILRDGEELPWRKASTVSPSLAAWRSYDVGRRSLDAWQLASAESAFQRAVAAEPSLARAHLWLSQTIAWRDTGRGREQAEEASRALDDRAGLSDAEAFRASNLLRPCASSI